MVGLWGKILLKWMMNKGTPIVGNLQMYIFSYEPSLWTDVILRSFQNSWK